MEPILLNGSGLTDQASLHTLLVQKLSLPTWYGKNLDALFDCLTDIAEETTIRFHNWEDTGLGPYADRVLRVFQDAAEENPHLHISIE